MLIFVLILSLTACNSPQESEKAGNVKKEEIETEEKLQEKEEENKSLDKEGKTSEEETNEDEKNPEEVSKIETPKEKNQTNDQKTPENTPEKQGEGKDKETPKSKDTTKPILSGLKDKTVVQWNDPEIMDGITAKDNVDGDLTSKIVASGKVNQDVPGNYKITYTIKDKAGNSTTGSRIIKIEKYISSQQLAIERALPKGYTVKAGEDGYEVFENGSQMGWILPGGIVVFHPDNSTEMNIMQNAWYNLKAEVQSPVSKSLMKEAIAAFYAEGTGLAVTTKGIQVNMDRKGSKLVVWDNRKR